MSELTAWKCPKCKHVWPMKAEEFPLRCMCGAYYAEMTESIPSQAEVAAHYGVAVASWFMAGCPTRSEEVVQAIIGICHACDFFDGEKCVKCRCPINDRRVALFSKVRMATEHCPVRKW